MALMKPAFLQSHPVSAGLLWTALFVPAFALLNYIQGRSLGIFQLLILALIAIPCGIAWGYAMRWYLNRRQRDAR